MDSGHLMYDIANEWCFYLEFYSWFPTGYKENVSINIFHGENSNQARKKEGVGIAKRRKNRSIHEQVPLMESLINLEDIICYDLIFFYFSFTDTHRSDTYTMSLFISVR